MQHLIKEFSMENLLALIEFTHFRNHAIDAFRISRNDPIASVSFNYVFSPDVPLSDIVYAKVANVDNKYDEFKLKAYKLYIKYIKSGSEFELNVPHTIRNRFGSVMGNYEKWMLETSVDQFTVRELVQLFDRCSIELVSLLNGSRQRLRIQSTSYSRSSNKSTSFAVGWRRLTTHIGMASAKQNRQKVPVRTLTEPAIDIDITIR